MWVEVLSGYTGSVPVTYAASKRMQPLHREYWRRYLGASNIFVESKTRTYHGRLAAGRQTAGRPGRAGPGRTGRRRVGSPRRQPTLLSSRASKTIVLNDSSEARTTEFICKSTEEQNRRLTTGSSAVYHWDRERSSFLAADQCTDAYLSL